MAQITLRDIPDDIYKMILQKQGEMKVEKNTCQYSLDKTVIKILRDYRGLTEKKNKSS